MSQDIVSDALNQIMNVIRAGKDTLSLKRYSKILISILAIAKIRGYIEDYKIEGRELKIKIGRLNGCNAIKPRYTVDAKSFDKYIKRYLPAKEIGILVVSTNQGLMTHQTAQEKKIGGSLIAYFY